MRREPGGIYTGKEGLSKKAAGTYRNLQNEEEPGLEVSEEELHIKGTPLQEP